MKEAARVVGLMSHDACAWSPARPGRQQWLLAAGWMHD